MEHVEKAKNALEANLCAVENMVISTEDGTEINPDILSYYIEQIRNATETLFEYKTVSDQIASNFETPVIP